MKKAIFLFLCTFVGGFASFTDPYTGLTFDVPSGYVYDEEESQPDQEDNTWWYSFVDEQGNQLSVEIEAYDHMLSLFELFHSTMTDGKNEEDGEEKNVVYDGLDFHEGEINGLEYTKCQLRALMMEDERIVPFYICDYLFVKDQYGISIGLIKKDDAEVHQKELGILMETILESIHFKE